MPWRSWNVRTSASGAAFHEGEDTDSPRWQLCGPWWPCPRRRCARGRWRARLRREGTGGKGLTAAPPDAGGPPARERGRERRHLPFPQADAGLPTSAPSTHSRARGAGGPTSRYRPPPGSEEFDASAPPNPEWAEGGWGRRVASTARICSQIDFVLSLYLEAPRPGACATALGKNEGGPLRSGHHEGQRLRDARCGTMLCGPGGANWSPMGTHRKCVSETKGRTNYNSQKPPRECMPHGVGWEPRAGRGCAAAGSSGSPAQRWGQAR